MSKFSGITFDLQGDLDAAQGISEFPRRVLRTQVRAVGTLRRRIATEAKRDIGREYNLKAARIAQGLRVRIVRDGIALLGSSRGINAIEFGATWSRTRRGKTTEGARFKFRRAGSLRAEPGTFIARSLNGARLVFERDVKRGKHRVEHGTNAGRMKEYLLAVYGPSVAQMLKHGGRPQRLVDFSVRVIKAELERQLRAKAAT